MSTDPMPDPIATAAGGWGQPPGGPPPGGGYGPPPGGGYGPPPPPGGYGPPPAPGGFAPPPPGGFAPPGYGMMPAAPFGVHPTTGMPYSDKQKLAAGLLQILVPFGIGRFYTGHTGIGIAQLLTALFCGVGVIWCVIDGIMMLTGNVPDAQGRPLRD